MIESEDIRFYCGLNEHNWNHHPMTPGPYACIAPVYGKTIKTKTINRVTVPSEVKSVLVDSGAFADRLDDRLSFEESMHRQVAHAYQFGYVRQISHVASYDLLIDEKWQDGERSKQRWSKDEAEFAVRETVAAAQYIASQRTRLKEIFGHEVGLALSAQGVEVEQYLRCTKQIVACMEDGDLFGLGGWCITGLLPGIILPSFQDIMDEVIPYLGSQGVKRVHVWGVIFPQALAYLLNLCDQHEIQPSTDSSGPCRYPVLGNWGYGTWRDNTYKTPPILDSCKMIDEHGRKAPTCTPDTKCRGLERCLHVRLTREYLAHLRDRELALYNVVGKTRYKQLSWLEEAV